MFGSLGAGMMRGSGMPPSAAPFQTGQPFQPQPIPMSGTPQMPSQGGQGGMPAGMDPMKLLQMLQMLQGMGGGGYQGMPGAEALYGSPAGAMGSMSFGGPR